MVSVEWYNDDELVLLAHVPAAVDSSGGVAASLLIPTPTDHATKGAGDEAKTALGGPGRVTGAVVDMAQMHSVSLANVEFTTVVHLTAVPDCIVNRIVAGTLAVQSIESIKQRRFLHAIPRAVALSRYVCAA
jgi:hypothetical protein